MAARDRAAWALAFAVGTVALFLALRSHDPTLLFGAVVVVLLIAFGFCRRALQIWWDDGDL